MFRLVFLFLATSFWALGFSPDLARIEPRGGQRGTEVKITLLGDRLYEPEEILLYHPGITVKSLSKGKDAKRVHAVLAIAPDCPLGEHPMRLRCRSGLTYMRTFWVGQFPTVMEAYETIKDKRRDLNDTFATPQKIPLNSTVQGVADQEDADYYQVQCKKGQRLSVEVEAMRLGRVMFDPYVAILDAKRFELAVSDDSPLLKRDCAASIIVPEDGPYTILIRESSYQGSPASQYRLHLGTFPRPRSVFPPAVKPGSEVTFTFQGDATGPLTQKIKSPQAPFPAFVTDHGLSSPSGNPVHVSPLDFLNESGPNQNHKQALPLEDPPAAPFAFHGIISEPGQIDYFRFRAKKGERLRLQVLARSLRSPLDSVISIRHDNKYLGGNDDQTGGTPDSRYDFEVPADGEYVVNIRDQLKRGGPDFTYRLEIQRRAPSLALTLPKADRVDTQKHKMIEIPRGNRLAIVPNIARSNLGCEVVFHAPILPPGVSVDSEKVSRSLSSFPILFEAKADAPIGGGLFQFEIEDPKSKTRGPFAESISHLYVNNQGDYQVTDTDKISLAVIEEAPFHLDLFVPPVPLVRNGTTTLKITARRAEGFDKKIKVTLPWKPPGVGAPVSVDIPAGKNEASLTLNANGDAPISEWPLVVTGESATDRGVVRVSSQKGRLQVTEPFVRLSLAMAATNPGKDTLVVANVEQLEPFPGEAQVILHALPHGVTSSEKTITAQTDEITFPLKVTEEARKGKHANLFCQVIITKDGHPIAHNVGHGGILRIDPPPPAPKEKTATVKKETAKPETPVKKPLSRLEQLRQSAAK